MPPKRPPNFTDLVSGTSGYGYPQKRPALASAGSCQSAADSSPYFQTTTQPSGQVEATAPEPEEPDQAQDQATERELYGTFDGKIVGVRYYNGYASPGEAVLCRREPLNQYDRNAIRVENVLYQQIGHLPRTIVSRLAPSIDRGDIAVEAQLTGLKEYYECPVRLFFYGPSDPTERERIESELKAQKLVKVTEMKKLKKEDEKRKKEAAARRAALLGLVNHGSAAKALSLPQEAPVMSLEDLLQSSEAVELRKGWDAVKTLAMGEEQLAQMPQAQQPAQLKATLLPYQLQGLAWMRAKEDPKLPEAKSDTVTQLWRRDDRGRYWNLASDFVCTTAPALFSGGILADDMGLGKTLQVISLILTGGPGTTLIVAPVSVMSNWEQQIRRHVKEEDQPKILIYHGSKKPRPEELFNHDVVITSYGTLAQDKGLTSQSTPWRRVVLDEGHIIRNVRTLMAQAACELQAKSRWVLTGTPIINSVKDLQSLLKFLHITGGIEQPEIFNSAITRRLASAERNGEALLQALMQDICLRRKKEMKFVDLELPKKTEYVHRITFHPDEKAKYDALLAEARGMLEDYQQKSEHGQKGRFQCVLERLLRLRQTCNHWTLCRSRINELMELLDDQTVVPLNPKNRALLQEILRLFIENQDDCAICYDPPATAVITNCKHVFCRPCITKAIGLQQKCPMCRNPLTEDDLIESAPEDALDDKNLDPDTQSSKTEAMIQILQATLKKEGSKVVIFSQWTSFLDIVQNRLDAAGLKYCRIDGSLSADKRDRAIDVLDNDPETRIMLASLAVCSVGLNLVSADTTILADSWWAPAIEDQAVDRIHRLGQKRETTIWRLVMDGTIEERVLDIQHDKRELVAKAFQEKEKGERSKETRMADVVKLLS